MLMQRLFCRFKIGCSRVIVVGVASVAFLNHAQRMLIAGNRILQAAGHIAGLRIAGQRRSIMRTMFQMPGTVDCQRFLGVLHGVARPIPVHLQEQQRKIGVRGGDVDISARIGGRLLQQVQRLFQLALRLIETTGFAVQHGHIVVQRGQASVGGGEDGHGRVKRLTVQLFGLLVLACGSHARGRVDPRRSPRLRVDFLKMQMIRNA